MEHEGYLDGDLRNYYTTVFLQSRKDGFLRAYAEKCACKIHPYELAAVYAEIGDIDKAFESLEHLGNLPVEKPLVADPRFDSIRRDARYALLLRSRFGF